MRRCCVLSFSLLSCRFTGLIDRFFLYVTELDLVFFSVLVSLSSLFRDGRSLSLSQIILSYYISQVYWMEVALLLSKGV